MWLQLLCPHIKIFLHSPTYLFFNILTEISAQQKQPVWPYDGTVCGRHDIKTTKVYCLLEFPDESSAGN